MSNEVSGSARNVVQARTIHGDVTITGAHSNDLGVYLKHQLGEVSFKVGTAEWFHLTITNRSHRDRLLEIRVESATTTGLRWEIPDRPAADKVALPADQSVRLRLVVHCTPSAIAGPDVLKVLVGEERTWWPSAPLPIHIQEAPLLDVDLKQPEQRVYEAGPYETVVTLTNKGNTDLAGELWLTPLFNKNSALPWVQPKHIRFIDGPAFRLGVGDPPLNVRIEITLPPPPRQPALNWRVPLRVSLSSHPQVPSADGFTITQSGDEPRFIKWLRTWMTETQQP